MLMNMYILKGMPKVHPPPPRALQYPTPTSHLPILVSGESLGFLQAMTTGSIAYKLAGQQICGYSFFFFLETFFLYLFLKMKFRIL